MPYNSRTIYEIESANNKRVNVIGREMYFRNNSTGKPTLIHFISGEAQDGSKAYCGFSSLLAQNIIGDQTDSVLESQCCKKCLKLMEADDKVINERIFQFNS